MTPPRRFSQQRYTPPDGSAQILLVRHGESQAFIEGQQFPVNEVGQGDPPLTPEGEEGAALVGKRIASSGERIAAIYVTTLLRTHQTAAPLAHRLGIDPVEVHDLREVFLGEWDAGLSRQKFADRDPIALQVIKERRWDPIPDAETAEQFGDRVRRGIEYIAQRHLGELAVAFVHGGVIDEVMHQATGADRFSITVDNTSITHLVVEPDRWLIRTFNDATHRWPTFAEHSSAPTV